MSHLTAEDIAFSYRSVISEGLALSITLSEQEVFTRCAALSGNIRNHLLYSEINDHAHIAAVYADKVARAHAFPDGNKRTALVCFQLYLDKNNIAPCPDLIVLSNLILNRVNGSIGFDELARSISDLMAIHQN